MAVAYGRISFRLLAVGACAAFVLLAILVAGPGGTLGSAHAQGSPAGIEQYLPDDDGSGPAGGGGAPGADQGGGGPGGAGAGPSADAGRGGELPFTGYPLTPLLIVLLVLLLAGLTSRAYLAIRGRSRDRAEFEPVRR